MQKGLRISSFSTRFQDSTMADYVTDETTIGPQGPGFLHQGEK